MNKVCTRKTFFIVLISLMTGLVMPVASTAQADYIAQKAEVRALAKLTKAPVVRDESGQVASVGAGELKTIYYDALKYEAKPTRVYAWIGIPKGASSKSKVPGIVLVHGGGGTAFKEWVEKWNARGYAAIIIAVEGQTDELFSRKHGERRKRKTHNWPGPKRDGIYLDSEKQLKDQWMYHAVADTILANSLLRSFPEVDKAKVGLMGISWGGVIMSTVVGIDSRFAFAIPTYGCGNLSTTTNQYGLAPGKNEILFSSNKVG